VVKSSATYHQAESSSLQTHERLDSAVGNIKEKESYEGSKYPQIEQGSNVEGEDYTVEDFEDTGHSVVGDEQFKRTYLLNSFPQP